MKAILHHIAKKNITKRTNQSTAQALADFLREEGYTKHGRVFSKGHHQFVFNGSGSHWAISYRKTMEVAS
jgi:hypothetical protein